MLGAFAEFETAVRRERQMEGVAKAKALGVYKGRKKAVDLDAVRSLIASGVRQTAIAKQLGISRASDYRSM
jgi:DNA invertase Pin-like site-specific DNA recombinase